MNIAQPPVPISHWIGHASAVRARADSRPGRCACGRPMPRRSNCGRLRRVRAAAPRRSEKRSAPVRRVDRRSLHDAARARPRRRRQAARSRGSASIAEPTFAPRDGLLLLPKRGERAVPVRIGVRRREHHAQRVRRDRCDAERHRPSGDRERLTRCVGVDAAACRVPVQP